MEQQRISLNLVDCVPPFPCISTEEYRAYTCKGAFSGFSPAGEKMLHFFVTVLNNPLKKTKLCNCINVAECLS